MSSSGVFGQTWSSAQQPAIVLDIVMVSIIGCCLLVYFSDIYRLLPGWGPVRKFDSMGNEDQLAREDLLRKEYMHKAAEVHVEKNYGAIGKPTWGILESPESREVTVQHPVYGQVKVRENFEETQQLRRESEWWAKDERYFIDKQGLHRPQLQINEPTLGMVGHVV
eukprot:TRINITY_DN40942_c0_g1_i1.p1 TRINITY_DN40942_c0_g1~~TRINITY_DN40942_c0_g1_i1.p1  ORF type:complete len:166 (-),score=26.97 TRINITY_DN40942_c0_g1_i1:24-521(-)